MLLLLLLSQTSVLPLLDSVGVQLAAHYSKPLGLSLGLLLLLGYRRCPLGPVARRLQRLVAARRRPDLVLHGALQPGSCSSLCRG